MIEFVCTPLAVRIAQLGCHGNHALSHCPKMFIFLETLFSHSWGPKKQFGANAKFSLVCKVGEIRLYGKGYPISVLI